MKKKTKTNKKTVKKRTAAVKKSASGHELPELVTVLTRIAERMESLESKMALIIEQTALKTGPSQKQVNTPQQQTPEQANHHQPRHRHQRQLYKTVCADCSKECEVPFKPTGERPIYCKECFAARKSSKNHQSQPRHGNTSHMHERKIKVIPKGLGRVTISEIVPVSSDSKTKPGKKAKQRK